MRLMRPKESLIRMFAYCVIILAAAFLYTAAFCILLIKFVYKI